MTANPTENKIVKHLVKVIEVETCNGIIKAAELPWQNEVQHHYARHTSTVVLMRILAVQQIIDRYMNT